MDELTRRVAVVTGAASGIGLGLAERFAAEGMSLVVADVEEQAIAEVASRIADSHRTDVLPVTTDVSDAAAVDALADAAHRRFGAVHVVCNNAGVLGRGASAWEASVAEWRWVLDVNLWGVIHGIRSFLPLLLRQDEGHLVNTASAAAWLSAPGIAPYAASKHAVLAISEALRLELAGCQSRVGVSVLCPQFVQTAITESERNWPDHLGPRPDSPAIGSPNFNVRASIAKAIRAGSTPAALAEAVVRGIRSNQFVISEAPDEIAAAADRRALIARGSAPRFGR